MKTFLLGENIIFLSNFIYISFVIKCKEKLIWESLVVQSRNATGLIPREESLCKQSLGHQKVQPDIFTEMHQIHKI